MSVWRLWAAICAPIWSFAARASDMRFMIPAIWGWTADMRTLCLVMRTRRGKRVRRMLRVSAMMEAHHGRPVIECMPTSASRSQPAMLKKPCSRPMSLRSDTFIAAWTASGELSTWSSGKPEFWIRSCSVGVAAFAGDWGRRGVGSEWKWWSGAVEVRCCGAARACSAGVAGMSEEGIGVEIDAAVASTGAGAAGVAGVVGTTGAAATASTLAAIGSVGFTSAGVDLNGFHEMLREAPIEPAARSALRGAIAGRLPSATAEGYCQQPLPIVPPPSHSP